VTGSGRGRRGGADRSRLRRRAFLGVAGAALAGATAGCGMLEQQSVGTPAVLADRPDRVYVPSHVEGMEMAGMAKTGRYRFALSYSYPHRFWNVDGDRTEKVAVQDGDGVHLMLTAWDAETGRVLPASNQRVTVSQGGETVVDRSLWRMISQNMGVHFGDNVPLAGEGTYDVTVAFGPVGETLTGALAGALGERVTASLSFEFSQATLQSISIEDLGYRSGRNGAVEPMQMEMMPVAGTPAAADLPGDHLGTVESGDVVLVATALSRPPAGVEGTGPYLAVSPRTRYNGYPLPGMSLSATVPGAEGPVFDDYLGAALGSDLGYHYGTVLEGLQDAGEVTLSPGLTPQLARHEGYETAFFGLPARTISL